MAATLGRIAEEHGIESLWTVEHVVVPANYQSEYPYSPDGRMPGPEESPIPDPLIWLTWVGAATTSLHLATGILILVFEKGVGNELFGFQQVDFLEAWVPLFLFAVLFGLSMDYHVFLLSRIRERYLRFGDNDSAVARGIGSTARLITGAALIIIAVFSGFAVGDLVMFQQMGFGVAVSLLIDATLIRCVLLPAAMRLLVEWNWYLPKWLEWLPDFHVEGAR